jgi:hypothetical protein
MQHFTTSSATLVKKSYRKRHDHNRDMRAFVSDYRDDKLFTNVAGRKHASFPNVVNDAVIRDVPDSDLPDTG